MKKFHKTLVAMAILSTASGVNAAAFQLAEVSTSGLGRAYAVKLQLRTMPQWLQLIQH